MHLRDTRFVLFIALAIKLLVIGVAYALSVNILNLIGVATLDRVALINFAPEIWLSLLALVFGTLIIVVSIASENTPKLIDLFIGDPKGRLYIWLIMLSSLENIYLQLFSGTTAMFFDNLIFLNSYVLLPCFVLLAIPYTFYILKNTKNDKVIERIYNENIRALIASSDVKVEEIRKNHLILFETINQLHDLLQYIQFKEPKGDIINRMGMSVRLYLEAKKAFPDSYFKISDSIKRDISFGTLRGKYEQIENERTFYEEKVLRVLGTTYLLLISDSHYELASLCGSELLETGKVATRLKDQHVINTVIIHFNTFLRYGITQGLRTKEIRNVYNTIFHYSQLVHLFVQEGEDKRILQCSQYLSFYAGEVAKLSLSDPTFIFLVEAFSWEFKKILIAIHTVGYPRNFQREILKVFTNLCLTEIRKIPHWRRVNYNGLRLIQMALCLFYLRKGEREFNELISESIIRDLLSFSQEEAREQIAHDCDLLSSQTEDFWEETDQGNRNIYYSPDTSQIPTFNEYILSKMLNHQVSQVTSTYSSQT